MIPFLGKNYGFCTGYIVMYLSSPFLNKMLDSISVKEKLSLSLGILFLFSFLAPITLSQYLQINGGYSFIWFIMLYLITGTLKEFQNVIERVPRQLYFIIYGLLSLVGSAAHYFNIPFGGEMSYNNPIVTICSFSLFLYFLKIKLHNKRINNIIGTFAPFAIAVFLIHANYVVERYFQSYNLQSLFTDNIVLYVLCVPVMSLIVYIICSLLEILRIKLYEILRITVFNHYISDKISVLYEKIVEKTISYKNGIQRNN